MTRSVDLMTVRALAELEKEEVFEAFDGIVGIPPVGIALDGDGHDSSLCVDLSQVVGFAHGSGLSGALRER